MPLKPAAGNAAPAAHHGGFLRRVKDLVHLAVHGPPVFPLTMRVGAAADRDRNGSIDFLEAREALTRSTGVTLPFFAMDAGPTKLIPGASGQPASASVGMKPIAREYAGILSGFKPSDEVYDITDSKPEGG